MTRQPPEKSQPKSNDKTKCKQRRRSENTGRESEGPMGDEAMTEESAKDPDVDRSKTPRLYYDV